MNKSVENGSESVKVEIKSEVETSEDEVANSSVAKKVVLSKDKETGKPYIVLNGKKICFKLAGPQLVTPTKSDVSSSEKVIQPVNGGELKDKEVSNTKHHPRILKKANVLKKSQLQSAPQMVKVSTLSEPQFTELKRMIDPKQRILNEMLQPGRFQVVTGVKKAEGQMKTFNTVRVLKTDANLTNLLNSNSEVPLLTPLKNSRITMSNGTQTLPRGKVTSSTDTKDLIRLNHKDIQTDVPRVTIGTQTELNLGEDATEEFVQDKITQDGVAFLLETGDVDPRIINYDVNMGQGPVPEVVAGAKVEQRDPQRQAKLQFVEDLKTCLQFNTSGNLPIHEAVLVNDEELLKRQCKALKALKKTVNIRNEENLSPLQMAVVNNSSPKVVETLVAYGADITETDEDGNNLLHMAVEHNCQLLFGILTNEAKRSNVCLIDGFNYEGLTPLMLCCQQNKYIQASMLLCSGASVNLRDKKSGRTALFHAAESSHATLVELLMKHQADARLKNFFGISPHELMFEIEASDDIKSLVCCKQMPKKRKIDETRPTVRPMKKDIKSQILKVFRR